MLARTRGGFPHELASGLGSSRVQCSRVPGPWALVPGPSWVPCPWSRCGAAGPHRNRKIHKTAARSRKTCGLGNAILKRTKELACADRWSWNCGAGACHCAAARWHHEVHDGDPPEVRRILHAVSGRIGAWPVYDILSLPAWHGGSVCLLGDAAHAIGPHVGQGASLALEDALVLAKCLRDIHDLPRAFSTFECLRRPRVEPIVKQSRRTGRQKASTGWIGRKIRDLVLPMFLKRGAHAANELYRYAVDWEARVA